MIAFIVTYWAEILLAVITAGVLGFCRIVIKEIKGYRNY
jgi:hypothetical protein